MENISSKKKNTALYIVFFASVILLIAGAIMLVVFLTGGTSIIGPWHSEAINEQVRFHDDNTVVIITEFGTYEASYVFDKGKNKGVITLDGRSIEFTKQGDIIILTNEDIESEFERGEMNIAPAAAQTTAAIETTGVAQTPETTAAALSPAATQAKTASPSPSPALNTPSPTIDIFLPPKLSIIPIEFPSIAGTWHSNTIPTVYYTFNEDDNTVDLDNQFTNSKAEGTYTYDKYTGTGTVDFYGIVKPFTVDADTLTFSFGNPAVFIRNKP